MSKNEDGIIDVDLAIAYEGEIKLTGGILRKTKGLGKVYTLDFDRIIDATNYNIEIRGIGNNYRETITQTTITKSYTLPDYGIYKARVKGYNDNLKSDWSEWIILKHNKTVKLICNYN